MPSSWKYTRYFPKLGNGVLPMINKAIGALLMLTVAFCIMAGIVPHAALAESGSIVYGSIYVDGSPMRGVIVTCGDQSTTTLPSGNYVFNLDTGITVQVMAIYDGYLASSDEFVTSAPSIRRDLNIAIPDTPTPTPAPSSQIVYVTVTVTPASAGAPDTAVREKASSSETPTPARAESPGFAIPIALICLACAASIISRKVR
jgi:hypothetical protein